MAKDETRDHILQIAGPIFAAEGFQGTTVRAICQAADVNVAAVNYYFGDKERLYTEAVKHARNLIERRWPIPNSELSLTPEERLKALIETFVQRVLSKETNAWQIRLLMRELVDPTRACEEMVQEGFRPFFSKLTEILRAMVPESTSDQQLRKIGFSIVGQCVFYRAHHRIFELMVDRAERETHYSIAQLADHIYCFSVAAICGISDPPGSSVDGPTQRSNQTKTD